MIRPLFALACVSLVAVACAGDDVPPAPTLDVELVEVGSVGLLDGPDEFVFNRVDEVRGLPDGSFVVLDFRMPAVSWFGPEGEFRGELSAVGQGPGEILSPRTVHATPAGELLVFDGGLQRISRFELEPGGIAYRTQWSVESNPYTEPARTLCAMEDGWWLAQPLLEEPQSVRILAEGGAVQRTVGDVRPPSQEDLGAMAPIAAAVMSSGMVLCAPDRSRVIWAPLRWEEVRAFDPSGELAWTGTYGDLQLEPYVLNPPAAGLPAMAGFPTVSNGAHYLQSLVRWSDETILLQYRFWSGVRRDPDVVRIESYEVTIDTGELVGRTEEFPLIADVQGDRVYLIEHDMFSRVRVLERR